MNMPHMDGLALTRFLKADPAYREIPVIMLTTEDAEKERESALQAGASRYLTKPISQSELVAEVRNLLHNVHA
jgi:two-component system chemotaxis response regulator CheY